EADDCIGTLAHQYKDEYQVTIVTGDLDMLQLVEEYIDVAIMRKGIGNYETFTAANFYELRGIHPYQIVDLKGMMGDTADNYPGIKGVGEKTGTKLLQKYDTVDNILASISELTPAMQIKFETDKEMLEMSRRLAKINCDVPLNCAIEHTPWQYDEMKVNAVLAELELRNVRSFM